MKFARYTAILFATFLALYGALLAASYVAFPDRQRNEIDTGHAKETLFGTEPKYFVFSLHKLDHDGPRVIFLGSSNVREGFRPELFKQRLGGVEVDNLAIGSAEMSEMAQVADSVYATVPRRSWGKLTFVVGIWYGIFVPESRVWKTGLTDVDNELLRYGLYSRSGRKIARTVPASLVPVAEEGLRPLLLISRMYDLYVSPAIAQIRVMLLHFAGEKPLDVTVTDRDTFVLSPAQRRASLDFWHQYMGPVDQIDNRQYERFSNLVRLMSRRGSRVVIVDLPLPSWHRDGVPYDNAYRRRIQPYLTELKALPGVNYISLRDGFSDGDFYDSAHPRPRVVHVWADRAAPAIAPAVRMSER